MESYASPVQHNRPQTPLAVSPMVTRCLPLGKPLENCLCILAYTYVYVYTCIILHQEERREFSSIESPSVVVRLTPLSLSHPLSLSLFLLASTFLSLSGYPPCHSTGICFSPSSSCLLHTFSYSRQYLFETFFSRFYSHLPMISILSVTGNFFFASPEVSKRAGRVLSGREGRINNPTDATQALKNILFSDRD